MYRPEHRQEKRAHGNRRPAQRTNRERSPSAHDQADAIFSGKLLIPAMMVSALAMERGEATLHDLEYEHPRRAPARARRINRTWQALCTAADAGPGTVSAWFAEEAGAQANSDAMAWLNGWDVIERSRDGMSAEEIFKTVATGHATLPLRAEQAIEITSLIRTLNRWDPLGITRLGSAQTPIDIHQATPLVRWIAIDRRREDTAGDVDEDDWDTASLRTALIAWGMAQSKTDRQSAALHAARSASAIADMNGDWARERLAIALTSHRDVDEAQTEDWMIATGLQLMIERCGNDTELARALRAVSMAGMRSWRTRDGRTRAAEIIGNARAIEAAARCADRLKGQIDPPVQRAIYTRWAQCAWALDDEDSCRQLARKAIAIDPQHPDAWQIAIRTTAKPWVHDHPRTVLPNPDDRRLWQAWHEAAPDNPGTMIAATIAQLTKSASGSRSAGARRRSKTRSRLAKQTVDARHDGADVEPRLLWCASQLLQENESREWNQGITIEHALLDDETLDDMLLIDIAALRLAEGRGIEPALEHLMARDREEGMHWRIATLAEDVGGRAKIIEASEERFATKPTVIERGLRGPVHLRAQRKARYEEDAERCTTSRARAKTSEGDTHEQNLWTLLEQIALAERRIHETTVPQYRALLEGLEQALATWSQSDRDATDG